MAISERDRLILEKIVEHCDEIKEVTAYFGEDFEVFKGNRIYINACAMPILQIGELCGHLTLNFRKLYVDIPWQAIRGMRNIVVHDYGKISATVLWETIHGDVVDLREFCVGLLK